MRFAQIETLERSLRIGRASIQDHTLFISLGFYLLDNHRLVDAKALKLLMLEDKNPALSNDPDRAVELNQELDKKLELLDSKLKY